MPETEDHAYYTARAAKARELADAATDPLVANIHRSMAAGYAMLASNAKKSRPKLHISPR